MTGREPKICSVRQREIPEELRDTHEKRVGHFAVRFVQSLHFFMDACELLAVHPETAAARAVVENDRALDEVDLAHESAIGRTGNQAVFIVMLKRVELHRGEFEVAGGGASDLVELSGLQEHSATEGPGCHRCLVERLRFQTSSITRPLHRFLRTLLKIQTPARRARISFSRSTAPSMSE